MGGGILRRDRPGAAAPPERKTLPAWPFLTVFLPRSPGGCTTLTGKTTAAAAAADAGVVFLNYGCHRIIHKMDNSNRPAPRVASAEATGERGQNL